MNMKDISIIDVVCMIFNFLSSCPLALSSRMRKSWEVQFASCTMHYPNFCLMTSSTSLELELRLSSMRSFATRRMTWLWLSTSAILVELQCTLKFYFIPQWHLCTPEGSWCRMFTILYTCVYLNFGLICNETIQPDWQLFESLLSCTNIVNSIKKKHDIRCFTGSSFSQGLFHAN